LREQLWRYFPALLELEDNIGAEWLLELWEAAPTPDTASRLCEATIAKLLKRHRIRRFDAAFVANTLCRPPVRVAAETVEAASASPDLENSERWIRSRSGWHAARLSAGRTFHNVPFTSIRDSRSNVSNAQIAVIRQINPLRSFNLCSGLGVSLGP